MILNFTTTPGPIFCKALIPAKDTELAVPVVPLVEEVVQLATLAKGAPPTE
ncbi:hypothetical protein D9M68_466970 [compost metagenome]